MSAMGDLDYLFIEELVVDTNQEQQDQIYAALDGTVRMVDNLRKLVPPQYIEKFLDLLDEYGFTTVGTALLDVHDEIGEQEDTSGTGTIVFDASTSGTGTFVLDASTQRRRNELRKIYIGDDA